MAGERRQGTQAVQANHMRSVMLERIDNYTSNISTCKKLTSISLRGIAFVVGLSNTEFEKVTQALEKEPFSTSDI